MDRLPREYQHASVSPRNPLPAARHFTCSIYQVTGTMVLQERKSSAVDLPTLDSLLQKKM